MILSKANIPAIQTLPRKALPQEQLFNLPEKLIQFGTGVLLRGLPDYFIDKANKQGVFNGRVVIVKSTSQGGTDAFEAQDNLFTHCLRGVEDGKLVEETVVNASISRVISARDQWQDVLACAADAHIQIVVSNTTDVGISLVKESVLSGVPDSYPGKLLAFLYKRYQAFGGTPESGMVIVPTELISDNGKKLRSIILELAAYNGLETACIHWLETANEFCSSLVDRIVPGRLAPAEQAVIDKELGYKDDLLIVSESYGLWAIEAKTQRSRELLSFSSIDSGVVLTDDILLYKELKLRLLNGAHTFTCALAMLAGFPSVIAAMQDQAFETFITSLSNEEIAPAITSEVVSAEKAAHFAAQVLDRFRNPYIEHPWVNISLQYTSKMALRNVPAITWFYNKFNKVPERMAAGFAAYLLLMRTVKSDDGKLLMTAFGKQNPVNDDKAVLLYNKWQQYSGVELVQQILSDTSLWDTDLTVFPGFADAVTTFMSQLDTQPAKELITKLAAK